MRIAYPVDGAQRRILRRAAGKPGESTGSGAVSSDDTANTGPIRAASR